MGLDMYLNGEKYLYTRSHGKRGEKKAEVYELGYWRKHPNLHGFVVERFADGKDECQEISLSVADIKEIIQAVKNRELPETSGFFFGKSDDSPKQRAEDIAIFEEAIAWLESPEEGVWRSVTYCASW